MDAAQAVALLASLAEPGQRLDAAQAAAQQLGAQAMLILIRDPFTRTLTPAPGLGKTLPGGAQWRRLLDSCLGDGVHRSVVPGVGGGADTNALACSSGELALVFLGGAIAQADAELLCALAPLLRPALAAQHALAATAGELQAAQSEIRQATSLMKALDEARAQVDRSLTKLDAQARSLEQARARAEEATQAKDQFMAMLGHELRNPLAPIRTALELLRMRGVWSQEHDVMERQVGHMIRLVEDLLDVSRIAGGKLTLESLPIDMGSVIARALETVSPLIDQRRQHVQVEVAGSGLWVRGDPGRLTQVFANLLTNASKYSDPGTAIEVRAYREGASLCVQVRDHGIGIEPGMLEEVFVLFHQQGRGLDRAQGGLGLGLAIVRNLVTLHQGSVEALSEGPGRGSCFVVRLPAVDPGRAMPPAALPGPRDVVGKTPVRVLLVDDNADAGLTLAMTLQLAGHEVRTAADAFEALEVVHAFRPDLAVLDIGLPVMDGYELASRLRRQHAGIKLIAVTGYGQPEDLARAEAAGFQAHLVKPVNIDRLMATMQELTEAH